MSGRIETSRSGGIEIIRIVRPEKRNALTQAMYRGLSDALEAGERDPDVRVRVLFGTDGVFTAGNDIGDFLAAATGGAPGEVLRFIRLLPTLGKPLIAGVDGHAVGIGATLLMHCDLVYAAPGASLATPFLDLGLVPEAASSLLMPAVMGYARAFELLVLGEVFSAERAREAGIVNGIVAAADLEAHVLSVAARLAAKPPAALALAKGLLRRDVTAVLQRTEEEARIFTKCLSSPEAREAFSAFLAKRKPDFSKLG